MQREWGDGGDEVGPAYMLASARLGSLSCIYIKALLLSNQAPFTLCEHILNRLMEVVQLLGMEPHYPH